jgi:hypothetical protein
MDLVFGKILTILGFSVAGTAIVVLAIFALILLRQQMMLRRFTGFERMIARALTDAQDNQRIEGERQLKKMLESLTILDPVIGSLDEFKQNLNTMEQKFDAHMASMQESIMVLGSDDSGDQGDFKGEFADVQNKLTTINEEIAKAHQWLDELRVIEKVVLNLIGPEKLRTLLEKEKGGRPSKGRRQPQETPGANSEVIPNGGSGSTRKSIL